MTAEATYTQTAVVVEALKICNRPYICVDAKLSQSVFDVTRQIFAGVFDQLRDSVLRPEKWSTTRPEEALDYLNGRFYSDTRLLVVFEEFQDILALEDRLDARLRAVMQRHQNISDVFVSTQPQAVFEIFGQYGSPFFHFGGLIRLDAKR